MGSFGKIKPSQNGKITVVYMFACSSREFLRGMANMSFNAIHKNKILANIFEFRVQLKKATSWEMITKLERTFRATLLNEPLHTIRAGTINRNIG